MLTTLKGFSPWLPWSAASEGATLGSHKVTMQTSLPVLLTLLLLTTTRFTHALSLIQGSSGDVEDERLGQLTGENKNYEGDGGSQLFVGKGTPAIDCTANCKCDYLPYPFKTSSAAGDVDHHDFLLTVNCSGLGLNEFPSQLPISTQVLDMSDNKIQNLSSLPRLPELLVLDISRNWLHRVDNTWLFEHADLLRVLRLTDNGLRRLDDGTFVGLRHLQELDLSGNILQNAELHAFAGLDQLQIFHMDSNHLYDVKRGWFLSMPSLIELHLSDNGLVSLDSDVLPLPRLQHLDISHNLLRRINVNALSATPELRFLNISGNIEMREFPKKALSEDILARLNILLADGLGMWRLESKSVSAISTKDLSLSYLPEIRSIGPMAFDNLPRLRTLQLHDCPRLAYLHPRAFHNLPQLRNLMVENNALLAVPASLISALPALQSLHLYHNRLRCDCNAYWLRKELSGYSKLFYAAVNRDPSTEDNNADSPSSFELASQLPSSLQANPPAETSKSTPSAAVHQNPTPGATTESDFIITQHSSVISEPDRIACYFPEDNGSLPLVQQPLQYFPKICKPHVLPFFPQRIEVSIGEPLDLECQGIGEPAPRVSWILPSGVEINASTHPLTTQKNGLSTYQSTGSKLKRFLPDSSSDVTKGLVRAKVREESILHISTAELIDSGTYGCRVSSTAGQDFTTVEVVVKPQKLQLAQIITGMDYITAKWSGSIPRVQLYEFQIFYRKADKRSNETTSFTNVGTGETGVSSEPSTDTSIDYTGDENSIDIEEMGSMYKVQYLSGSRRAVKISNLAPGTQYEICLVYLSRHRLQCKYVTTRSTNTGGDAAQRAAVRSGASAGIAVHVSRAQVGAGIGIALGLLVTIWAALVVRRLRKRGRKDYQNYGDPFCREDKTSIPLEGLVQTPTPGYAPSTPLTSSRTALLTHSQM